MRIDQVIGIAASIIGDHPTHRNLNNNQISRLLNVASLKLLRKKIGLPEAYSPGMPVPPEVTEITRKNKEDIRVFLVELGFKDNASLPIDSGGFADIPTNLYYCSTLEYWKPKLPPLEGYDIKPIEILTDTQFLDRVSSAVIDPDYNYPICNFQNNFIRFAPKDIQYAHMIYYRYPVDCVYAIRYENNMPVFDEDNSVDLEWNDDNTLNVINIFLGDIGISIEKQEIVNYAELHKQRGV